MKMKHIKTIVALALTVVMLFGIVPPIKSEAAFDGREESITKEWMRSSRSLQANKMKYYDLLDDKNNLGRATYYNAHSSWEDCGRNYVFSFSVSRPVYMTYEIRIGGKYNGNSAELAVALYDLNGQSVWGKSKSGYWDGTYDSSKNETVIRVRDTELVNSERYLAIGYSDDVYEHCKDTYVKITLTPRIPRTERINEIKKYGKQSVFLRWSKTTAATGYEVYRAETKAGAYTKIKTVTGGKIRCTINNVKKNKTYYYKVKAYRVMNGKKYYSNSASIKAFTLK